MNPTYLTKKGGGSDVLNVRALVERLPGHRSFPGYSQFKCPCCGTSGLAQFDDRADTAVVDCSGDCSQLAILTKAEQLPAPRVGTTRAPVGRPWSDYEAASRSSSQRPTASGLRPGVQRRLDYLRDDEEAKAIFDAEQGGTELQPILSSLVDAEPVSDPSILRLPDGTHLLRRGWVHLFHGKPYCGKTPLTYLAVVEVAQAGGHVLLVDYEMGASGAKALLIELGLMEDQIRDHVLYAYNPRRWTQTQRDGLVAEVEARVPDLVVIDSLSRSMATEGLNQNDATETDVWFHSLPSWAADQFGSAVMLIDHTNRADGPHPSGSIQKTAAPQFHVWVQNVRSFSREHEDGCSLLTVQKDRSGQRPLGRPVAELRTTLGGSFTLRAVNAPAKPASGDEVEVDFGAVPYSQQVRIDVLDMLRQAGAEGITKTKVTDPSDNGDGGGAYAKDRRKALDWLEKQGQASWKKEPGTSRGQRWWAAEFAPGDDDE